MPKIIAVAGKGGTGKTTFTALLLRYLMEKNKGTILAVDADPNANLNEALGLKTEMVISDVLAEIKDGRAVPSGMTKDLFIQYKLQQAMTETEKLDLLVMGNPQGPGCYCYPNDLLREYLEKLAANYDYLMVDSEAGLEHLSRRTIPRADLLFVMSDPTARGLRAAARVKGIVETLRTPVQAMYLVISRVQDGVKALEPEIQATGLPFLGTIPLDPEVVEFDLQGRPLVDLPPASQAVRAVESLLAQVDL